MSCFNYIALALGTCAAVGLSVLKVIQSRKDVPLPPGPPALPLIGHAHLIPSAGQAAFFYNLGKLYGDVVYLKVFNKSFVVLNSAKAAFDLIDRKGGNYRNRPRMATFEILGFGGTMAFLDDSEEYRSQRKMFHQFFSKDKVKEYRGIQLREARILAQNLISDCENYSLVFLRFSAAILIDVTFGHQVVADLDPYMQIAKDCTDLIKEKAGPPGGTPGDFLPILNYLPSWFPGTYYAELSRRSSWKFRRLLVYPFEKVKEQTANGTARPSFIATQLDSACAEGLKDDVIHEERIKNAAAVTYVAGAETTSSTLLFFLLAMVLYPDCQAHAQLEIDSVVGDRLPEFHDRERTPYLDCVLQETLRWNHAVPAGVPRTALEDDVYNGMLIPKGSTVITNTRGITLDESVYANPSAFDPTRFLPAPAGRGEPFPTAQYGYGRRKCPGRYLADDSLWIVMATILATVNIIKARDKDGKEIIPEVVPVATGISSQPESFPFNLEPRSKMVVELLERSEGVN